ncbi:MAG TPA: hypothetical protein PLP42_10855, partial [Acidobacteriota bacterium]|nr:hypothetical protein [Acidobacteriota bacterium]
MSRSLVLALVLLTGAALVIAEEDATGNWEGSFQTQEGYFGSLTALVSIEPDGTYKADVSAYEQGIDFRLPGRKVAEKVVFSGTVEVSPEIGSMEINGEIAGEKFSGTFKGNIYSGTFELK